MESMKVSSPYVYPVSIGLTILVIALSVVYTMRNILRIWNRGNPHNAETTTTENTTSEEEIDSGAGGECDSTTDVQESESPVRDPLEYCEHIQSEVKKAKQRVAAKKVFPELTSEQLEEERRVQREQLEAIFKLMEKQGEKFGVQNMEDMQQQMKLYA